MAEDASTTPPAAPGDPKNLKNQPGPRQAEGGEQKPPGAGTANTAPPKPLGLDEEEKDGGEPGDGAFDGVHGPEGEKAPEVKVENLQEKPAPPMEKLKKNSHKRLTQEQAERLSRAELRAVALDRGYEVPRGGRAISVNAFLKSQEEDKTLDEAEKADEPSKAPAPVSSVPAPFK